MTNPGVKSSLQRCFVWPGQHVKKYFFELVANFKKLQDVPWNPMYWDFPFFCGKFSDMATWLTDLYGDSWLALSNGCPSPRGTRVLSNVHLCEPGLPCWFNWSVWPHLAFEYAAPGADEQALVCSVIDSLPLWSPSWLQFTSLFWWVHTPSAWSACLHLCNLPALQPVLGKEGRLVVVKHIRRLLLCSNPC